MSSLDNLQRQLTIEDVQRGTSEQQAQLKLRCQTDLRFLVNSVLRPVKKKRFPSLIERVHGPIFDSFPKADPRKSFDEWDDKDEFVIMASRGMLKSTIGMGFLTQVILCDPDIRILIMSGNLDKAKSILAGAVKPFITNDVLRFLFPDWAIGPDGFTTEEFTCPQRDSTLQLRDPTLKVASFDSVKAGWHGELIILDDATNEINSSNVTNCEKTYGTYDDCDELLEPGGYRVFLATKWHEVDLPWYIWSKGEEEREATGRVAVHRLIQPAWHLRNDGVPEEIERRKLREKMGTLREDDVELVWPEKLNARFLFKKYRKNREDFYKQYLLDASISDTPHSFPEPVLLRQITSPNDLKSVPFHDRAVVVHWDLASAFTGRRKKSESDFSCGAVCVFQCSTMKMWVVQIALAHFTDAREVANAVVHLYRVAEFYGEIVGHSMEDAVGVRWLQNTIDDVVRATSGPHDQPIRSITFELPENDRGAKNARIAMLAAAMDAGHVYLMSNMQFLSDVRLQFEKWTMDAKRRKDDAPDCIAQVWKHYRPAIFPRQVENMEPIEPVVGWESKPPQDTSAVQESESKQDEASAAKDMGQILNPYSGV
jgi:hypothetical protein